MWDLIWNGRVVFSAESRSKVGWEAMRRNMAELRNDGEWYYREGASCVQRT